MQDIKHIAIILDGNGRWAKAKGLPRTAGHKVGVEKVREIALYANSIGIKCLTMYSFSTENWKRPLEEVNYIFSLPKIFFKSYLKELMENNVKIEMIGNIDKIPEEARNVFLDAIEETKNNTGLILNFAVNYGSRDEIVKAANKFAMDYKDGKADLLTEETFNNYLMTSHLPEVDFLIRTSNEQRLSNYLLYQLAYSEFIFTDTLWPDFTPAELDKCIEIFKSRGRRFGGVENAK